MFQSRPVRVMNGIAALVGSSNGYVYIYLMEWVSSEKLSEMDGLCNYQPGSYRHRNGEIRNDATGFVESWRCGQIKIVQ